MHNSFHTIVSTCPHYYQQQVGPPSIIPSTQEKIIYLSIKHRFFFLSSASCIFINPSENNETHDWHTPKHPSFSYIRETIYPCLKDFGLAPRTRPLLFFFSLKKLYLEKKKKKRKIVLGDQNTCQTDLSLLFLEMGTLSLAGPLLICICFDQWVLSFFFIICLILEIFIHYWFIDWMFYFSLHKKKSNVFRVVLTSLIYILTSIFFL